MSVNHGRFVWYELLTTDLASATAFYGKVLGWRVRDASTPGLAYSLFISGRAPVSGLMQLPQEATKMGAMSRWVGYVNVDDIDAVADHFKRLGGTLYVPPTDSNIGRVAVVADPQSATFALVKGLKLGYPPLAAIDDMGRVGWHELHAGDWTKAFAFYDQLFGWQKPVTGSTDTYQSFVACGQVVGGMFTKRPQEPVPFWLYYFNVDDVDAAAKRVTDSGGLVFEGPYELPDGSWVARCRDPQGTAFALQGPRSAGAARPAPSAELGFSTEWEGFSSKGRMVGKTRNSEPEK